MWMWIQSNAAAIEATMSLGAVIVSIIGFVFVVYQLRQNRLAMEENVHAQVYNIGHNVYATLSNNSEIYPYFYSSIGIPDDDELRSQVYITAEMLADFFEYIIHGRDVMAESLRVGWIVYMQKMYQRSLCFREYVHNNQESYSGKFIATLKNQSN